MWRLLSTVDLLKHGLPDPSSVTTSHSQASNIGTDKDNKDKFPEGGEEYMATPVFIHTKLRDEYLGPQTSDQIRKALTQYFLSSSFTRPRVKNVGNDPSPPPRASYYSQGNVNEAKMLDLFLVPRKSSDYKHELRYESYDAMLWKIRGHVLSMARPSFSRTVSEREWLKNTAKIWELIKNSPIIAEYCKMLQSSGLFKK